jgi:hypothetical protein
VKIDIVAIIEENIKEYKQRQRPEFEQYFHPQQQQQQHRRFVPLMGDNYYNCELCGVGVAVLQIVTSTRNGQEQFKVCNTCLKEYIDQVAAKK